MPAIIKALYGPILHPIDAANFTDEDGDVYHLHGKPRFTQKLGKKVLILDIDSRPLTGEGQLMNKELKWKGMRPLSAGMLSHYMFGRQHRGQCMCAHADMKQRAFTATTTNSSAHRTTLTAGAPGSRYP